jgi:LPS sulfotransferase NodH
MIHPDLQTWLMTHPVHSYPKDPQSFRFGRWHEHRLSLIGLRTEAIKHVKAALKPKTSPQKILVFGRPRSGTTLLGSLLAQIPRVHDEGEYLHFGHAAPLASLEACAHTTACEVFVAKLLSYQMLEVQQISDGYAFFKALKSRGYRFVHLRRNSFNQALSLCTARATGAYFLRGKKPPATQVEIEIDPETFLAELRRTLMMLAYEDLLMSGFDHVPLQYETDLREAGRHQGTVDRLCAAFEQPSAPVAATLPRTGGKDGVYRVINRDALEARCLDAGLERALSDHMPEQRSAPRRRQAAASRPELVAAS